jgi:uncharacterized protein YheU (UPF0270 family)
MEDAAVPEAPIEVPAEALSPEALRGVIEDFILREGTDYGRQETEHATKVERVRAQLQAGEVKIIYDPNSESVTLVTRAEWRRRLAASGSASYT